MPTDTRTTIYLKPKVYRALKVKAATTDRSVSDLVNAAVLESLRGDAVDLEAFDRRAKEPSRPFEKVLENLKRDGSYTGSTMLPVLWKSSKSVTGGKFTAKR
ncbi:MAG: ribbon-helix-helix protein, CopG family [Nitrospira sp.]